MQVKFKLKFQATQGVDGSNISMVQFGLRVWLCVHVFSFFPFSFFFLFQPAIVDKSTVNNAPVHCLWVPQITLFNNFFIKNGFHSTIYKFKNYFAIVFSVSVFNFSKNKLYPNGHIWFLPFEGTRHVAKILKTNSERWQEVCIWKNN